MNLQSDQRKAVVTFCMCVGWDGADHPLAAVSLDRMLRSPPWTLHHWMSLLLQAYSAVTTDMVVNYHRQVEKHVSERFDLKILRCINKFNVILVTLLIFFLSKPKYKLLPMYNNNIVFDFLVSHTLRPASPEMWRVLPLPNVVPPQFRAQSPTGRSRQKNKIPNQPSLKNIYMKTGHCP